MRCLGGGCQRGRAPQPLAAFHPRTAHVTAPCCWGHDRSCGAATGPHRLIRQAMMHPLRRCSACMYVHTCVCTYIHTSIGQYTVHASARKEGAHRQKREHRIEEAGGHPKGPSSPLEVFLNEAPSRLSIGSSRLETAVRAGLDWVIVPSSYHNGGASASPAAGRCGRPNSSAPRSSSRGSGGPTPRSRCRGAGTPSAPRCGHRRRPGG